jgi:hypothetical protein
LKNKEKMSCHNTKRNLARVKSDAMAGKPAMSRPIIFKFDGVIVDSEVIANRAMAECLTAHGF